MKLSPTQTQTLVEVLNAQTGKTPINEKEVYKAKVAEVIDFLETKKVVGKDGNEKVVYTGGIKKEVYRENKENTELVEAAKNHLDAAKKRSGPKPPTPAQEAPETDIKTLAEDVVRYLKAKTEYLKTGNKPLSAEEEPILRNKVGRLLDKVKGGLSNEPMKKFGGKSPWQVMKNEPGVKDACLDHQGVKSPKKAATQPENNEVPLI
jgi:hypothetical protein